MKKLLLLPLFALLFVWGKVEASHIVGGEIIITHVQGFQYVMTMNLYRDASGISAPATAAITAYQRSNQQTVGNWTLPKVSFNVVPPQIAGCAGQQLTIERHFYQDTVQLPPTTFNHASGYLFTWTSCCRNAGVINLQNSGGQGQTTATLFPPVVDGAGNQIVNSTPQLFPPLADYGCVGQLYYQPFGGVDPDGDSLSYVLYTPFDQPGAPGPGIVNPISAPYPDPSTQFTPGLWANCYNQDNQINGFSNPACGSLTEPDRLKVDVNTGFVTVTPSVGNAYFVIGVWAQEWRDIDNDGQKDLIGSVFRDFQLQVSPASSCSPQVPVDPPVPVDSSITITDTVFVPGIVGQRCIQYKVSDPGAGSAIPNGTSNVEIIVDAVNFPDSTINLTPANLALNNPSDTFLIDLCFGDCAFSVNGEPLELNIIYKKEHCPQPFFDTIRLFFLVQEIPSPEAKVETRNVDFPSQFFVETADANNNISEVEFFIRPNWEIEFSMGVIDSTYDSLFQYIVYNNDTLDYLDYGMEFFQYTADSLLPADSVVQTDTIKGLGEMETVFRWVPDCSLFDPGQVFRDTIYLITEDRYCGQNISSKRMIFNILNTNERPTLLTALGDETTETPATIQGTQLNDSTYFYSFTQRVGTDRSIGGSGKKKGESLIFDLEARDPDLDELFTEYYIFDNARGEYLDLLESRDVISELGISTGRSNNNIGDSSLASTFFWENRFITCEALEYAPIMLRAVTTDSSCFAAQAVAEIEILLDNGTPPQLELYQDLDGGTELIPRDADGNVEITFSSKDLSFFVTGFDLDTVEIDSAEFESDKVRLGLTLEDLDINDTEDVFQAKKIEATYRNPLQYVEKNDTIFFFWDPACEDRETPLDRLNFRVRDNACPVDPDDTELGLIDDMFVNIVPVGEFNAINVITPNGDGYNDRLELYAFGGFDEEGRNLIVEPMQCGFESIKVYNRYGQLVFESEEKDFSWDAANVPSGDYFYQMKFGNRTYKSYIKVLK